MTAFSNDLVRGKIFRIIRLPFGVRVNILLRLSVLSTADWINFSCSISFNVSMIVGWAYESSFASSTTLMIDLVWIVYRGGYHLYLISLKCSLKIKIASFFKFSLSLSSLEARYK